MNFTGTKHLILVLILQVTINEQLCAPLQSTDYSSNSLDCCSPKAKRQIPDTEAKKNIFVSRGWGAGGMPFSVLYLSPHSSKAPLYSEPMFRAAPLSAPKLREEMEIEQPPKLKSRRQYSVIPQLFVSYGWGPMGKK